MNFAGCPKGWEAFSRTSWVRSSWSASDGTVVEETRVDHIRERRPDEGDTYAVKDTRTGGASPVPAPCTSTERLTNHNRRLVPLHVESGLGNMPGATLTGAPIVDALSTDPGHGGCAEGVPGRGFREGGAGVVPGAVCCRKPVCRRKRKKNIA
ncbi:hypothetical protein GWK47_000282 [Chionoecetes opilio]|uniref:Uncharacterized protein n=1 Tax=Chionoecetes opilio TaxID=41210 RepID=A0A8J8WBP6_CHIOP|nr:hypothetical protein GWK47_000282 [Chionoecetes opilio]